VGGGACPFVLHTNLSLFPGREAGQSEGHGDAVLVSSTLAFMNGTMLACRLPLLVLGFGLLALVRRLAHTHTVVVRSMLEHVV
jgi:hypothetical protein